MAQTYFSQELLFSLKKCSNIIPQMYLITHVHLNIREKLPIIIFSVISTIRMTNMTNIFNVSVVDACHCKYYYFILF